MRQAALHIPSVQPSGNGLGKSDDSQGPPTCDSYSRSWASSRSPAASAQPEVEIAPPRAARRPAGSLSSHLSGAGWGSGCRCTGNWFVS